MADYVTNLTGTAQVDDSIVESWSQQILVAAHETLSMDQFASEAVLNEGSKWTIPKYSNLTINTTPLDEREEVTSKALADVAIEFSPVEYGDVVTKTLLSSLQTGGRVDLAAAQVVGVNMGQVQNKLACLALDASSNGDTVDGGLATALTASDVKTGAFANKAYNALARKSIMALGGMQTFVAVAHDDVLHDIRQESGWVDAKKYADPSNLLLNEVGMYKGFRWVRNNLATIDADGGDTNVDVYNTYFLGFNGLGKATQLAPQMRMTGPFDKLARFVNVGWLGILDYSIVDADAVFVGQSASSVGANS